MIRLDPSDERRFDLLYTGGPADDQRPMVPAPVLYRALEGLQRLVHLLGMRREGRELNKRARPSRDVQRRYSLLCLPPMEGSYISPVQIGGLGSDLLSDEEQAQIAKELTAVLEVSGVDDPTGVARLIPDPSYRRFMMDAVAALVPDESSGLQLHIQRQGKPIFHSSEARQALQQRRQEAAAAPSWGVITGKLIDIDFAEGRFGLLHVPSSRRLECTYEPAVEGMLLDHPLDLIQVSGLIERDEAGSPVRMVQVGQILEIDDSPYTIEGFSLGNMLIRAGRPIEVAPAFDADDLLFVAEIPAFGIDAFGETREQLESQIVDELRFLWADYASAEDDALTPQAQRLKQKLLGSFHEELHAAQA